MADQTGPFTLEQINTVFGYTSLDSVAYSLDSSVWQTATAYEGSANVSSTFTTSSITPTIIKTTSASINSIVSATAEAQTVILAEASVSVVCSTSCIGSEVFTAEASVTCVITTSADGDLIAFGASIILGIATTSLSYIRIRSNTMSTSSNIAASMNGEIRGKNWNIVTSSSETWSDIINSNNYTWSAVSTI